MRQVDRAAQGVDNLEEMDDCMYSLDSDPRSARRPSNRIAQVEEAPAGADSSVS